MPRRLYGLALGVAMVAASLGTTAAADSASPDVPAAPAGGVDVWVSDPAAGTYLTQAPSVSWRRGGAPEGSTIAIDETRRYQRMEGFGASFTDSSAWLVGTRLDTERRNAAMRDLFSARDGIGLSFVRQPMGASDFAVEGNYSYDDMPAGETDPTLAHFSIDHDRAYIIPLLTQARKLNPQLTLMASPWSPPGWMKTSDNMIGGTLEPDAYQPLADYFAKFIQAYANEGIPIRYISPNNEPLYIPGGYPGLGLSAEEAGELIRNHLGPTLRKHELDTRILGYDHNWDVISYPESLYADPETARHVHGTAWHCYGGDVRAQSLSHNNYPAKPAYHTECSGGEWEGTDEDGFAGAIGLVINSTRDWAKSVVRWNMALDAANGPTNGGCLTCRGVLKVTQDANGGWDYAKTVDYYALGHASKFVRPGARRIASNTLGAGNVADVAFVNPDGSKAVVAHNSGTERTTFQIQWGDRWFSYALAPGAAATFVWSGRQHGEPDADTIGQVDLAFRAADGSRPVVSYDAGLLASLGQVRVGENWLGYSVPTGGALEPPGTPTALPRDAWTVSASASAPADPAGQAIDGDPATRWSTGAGMAPGDWFQVDLGAPTAFSEISLDTLGSPGDFVRGYEVYVSDDGETWGEPIARGGGRTQLRVLVPPVQARYVRIVNTGSSGSWWSIHELNLLAPEGAIASNAAAVGANAAAAGANAAVPTVTTTGEGDLQRRTASLPDGTQLEVVYNAGQRVATFEVSWAGTAYTYRLPAGATAAFTRAG
ncbi:discoidin domain-containing protein [Actinopolymorpha sp. B9G3]|uniref:discoidin domain-containing protein n=1 Tax=Actinopolymorpha sp. B9G3 TaxID=3158970 RepID=UPI0032D9040E